MNNENLKRFGKEKPSPTREEAQRNGKKGGEANSKRQKELKTIKDILQDWASDGLIKEQEELLKRYGFDTKSLSQLGAIIKVLGLKVNSKNATIGDILNFLKFYSDYTGQKPAEEITGSLGINFIVSNEEEKKALEEV